MNQVEPTSQPVWVVNVLTFLIALLTFYLSFEYVWQGYDQQKYTARRQLTSLVDLVSDNIARAVAGTRESLRLISRMPVMRESRFSGILAPVVAGFFARVAAVEVSEENLKERVYQVFQARDQGAAAVDLVKAGARRASSDLGLGEMADEDDEGPVVSTMESANRLGGLLFETSQAAKNGLLEGLERLAGFAALADEAFGFGSPVPGDVREIGRLLQVSLSDRDLIQSLQVQTLEGQELVNVTEAGVTGGFWGRWQKSVRHGTMPFYSGPVWFDERLGRPLWNVATPMRDLTRRPFGVLSAQVDLAFLQELMKKSQISTASHLLIVDEDGIVISHPKFSMVANQINVSKSNPAVQDALTGAAGFREFRWGHASFFAAFRNLKTLEQPGLPGWGIIYLAPMADFGSSFWKLLLNAILGIILILFLLYHVNSFVISSLEEDWEP